jgi:signal transduction histidine kinase
MDTEPLGNSNDTIALPAHELRSALQTILGFTQLLQVTARDLTAAQAGYLANVETAASGLLARASSGRSRAPRLLFERVSINVDEAISAVVRELAPARAAVGVEIKVHTSGLTVRGDREQFEQMLANLLTCALRSTAAGRALHFRTHRSSDAVQITLSDTGIVIPHELTSARRLAELMGGDLDWRHVADGSTAVTARLPAA